MLTNHTIMIISMMAALGAALVMMRYLRGDKGFGVRGTGSEVGPDSSNLKPCTPHPAPCTSNPEPCTTDAIFDRSVARLQHEIAALSRRGNLNLTIGVITTGFAVGLLAYMVMNEDAPAGDTAAVLAHYIPRVTTVSFIEVFSYFFLRLYRASLAEIKFYQNELTALASQQIALDASRTVDPAASSDGTTVLPSVRRDPAAARLVIMEIARHNPNSAPADGYQLRADSSSDPRLKLALELVDRLSRLVLESKIKTV